MFQRPEEKFHRLLVAHSPRRKVKPGHQPMIALHLFPRHIMAIGLVVGLVEVLVGTVAGAWLYREETA